MKENNNYERNDDQKDLDQDQLRGNTMNETIREASGDRDTDLNELRESDNEIRNDQHAGSGRTDSDITQGISYNPNDTSAVRSGGTTDMDDQTASGAGLNTGTRQGSGSHLKPKTGLTGSDFDGQDRTS